MSSVIETRKRPKAKSPPSRGKKSRDNTWPLQKLLSAPLPQIRRGVSEGFGKVEFEKCVLATGTTQSNLAKILHLSTRTLNRRKKLSPTESDRLLRIVLAFRKAVEVLEGEAPARKWFTTPKRALENCTPLEYCGQEQGAKEVENLLGRIEHGVFS